MTQCDYLVIFRSGDDAGPIEVSAQRRRLEWLDQLRNQGVLVMSGPSSDRSQSVCLFRVHGERDVERIIQGDPLLGVHWTSAETIEWEIHVGRPPAASDA